MLFIPSLSIECFKEDVLSYLLVVRYKTNLGNYLGEALLMYSNIKSYDELLGVGIHIDGEF
jgi:hypothetical protein